jgi:CheY-like chemotaxis protein
MATPCGNCVLLVDDDEALPKLLSMHLTRAGFDPLHAGDGIEGLAVLRYTLPKVIISDLQMPRMSGLEFIGVVRQRFPTIPVIVFSGLIPRELPEDIDPDCWIQKSVAAFPDVVRTVNELAREAPDDVDLPEVVCVPVRAGPGFAGCMILTCTDCLRTFRADVRPAEAEGTAACTHCDARVPYVIESLVPRVA